MTRVVIERERSMLMAYGDLYPAATPAAVSTGAVAIARRRRIAFGFRAALGAVALGGVAFVVVSRIVPQQRLATITQDVRYGCLSPEEAIALIKPYLFDHGSISYNPATGPLLRISAPPQELQAAQFALDRMVRSGCAVRKAGAFPATDQR